MKINNMEKEQWREWAEAQKITVSVDLVEAAKNQLKFLAAIDQSRFLYEDHALQRAIYRYNAFWLPLLAKHLESPISEESLVVPLDCELIWHCHRLNPVRYKFDCEKLFGRVLGNHKVISSVEATSTNTTKKIWNNLYPEEPYELDLNKPFSWDALQKSSLTEKFTNYDLVSAVKRQIPFTSKILSKPYMSDDLCLQEVVARYKGFLHLFRKNKKMSVNVFCVPTIDIDLVWHTHQLHPDSYCKDMIGLVGFVVQHDDDTTESDQTKGGKLDIGFSKTTRQWEQVFGFSYQSFGPGPKNRGKGSGCCIRCFADDIARASENHENASMCGYFCVADDNVRASENHGNASMCGYFCVADDTVRASENHGNASMCGYFCVADDTARASENHENASMCGYFCVADDTARASENHGNASMCGYFCVADDTARASENHGNASMCGYFCVADDTTRASEKHGNASPCGYHCLADDNARACEVPKVVV